MFSEARTSVDPLSGINRTDESINDAKNAHVYTVWRAWNRSHTEEGCHICPSCTAKPLPQKFITEPKLLESGVDCALGTGACDRWAGNYQGPAIKPVIVLVSANDVQQLVKVTWPAASPNSELYIDYSHWNTKTSKIVIPTDCSPDDK